jgi:hypothetical protein
MLDETPPFAADPFSPERPEAPAASTPDVPTSFSGRTPGRASAVRAGIVLGAALVVALGTAVVMAASPSPSTTPSGAGAQPSPAASGGAKAGQGDQKGPKAFRGGFGPFAFGFGPIGPGGPADGRGFGDSAGGRFGQITVTAVNGSTISLKTDDGWTRTITVTSDTKVTKGGEAATASDIAVGDTVRIAQKKNADGTFTVTGVAIVLPRVAGTVTAVDATTITITDRKGVKQTIHTNGATTYHAGGGDGTRADVTVGANIAAVGEQAADGSITATSVNVALPRLGGTITSVSGNTITLTDRKGTKHTIHVSSDTQITVFGKGKATVSDLKAGMVMAAQGRQRSDGSLDATTIGAGTLGQRDKGDKPNGQPKPSSSPTATTG